MRNQYERTRRLLGDAQMKRLQNANVAVFGIGGVGSYTVEALARSGVGSLALFDGDVVDETNINRQLIALKTTVGLPKVEAAKERIHSIDPDISVEANQMFFEADNADMIDFSRFSYVVDAIDTVTSKLILIESAKKAGVPVISCMGAGNKLDPTKFEVADIYETSVCPLARVMRKELKARNINSLKVVYSKEEPIKPLGDEKEDGNRKKSPGSIAFVPSIAGLIIAGEVIKDIAYKR